MMKFYKDKEKRSLFRHEEQTADLRENEPDNAFIMLESFQGEVGGAGPRPQLLRAQGLAEMSDPEEGGGGAIVGGNGCCRPGRGER